MQDARERAIARLAGDCLEELPERRPGDARAVVRRLAAIRQGKRLSLQSVGCNRRSSLAAFSLMLLAGGTLGRAGWDLAGRAVARETAYPGLRELVQRTYDAIGSGSPPPIGAEETLAVAVARDAIIKAAAGQEPGQTPP